MKIVSWYNKLLDRKKEYFRDLNHKKFVSHITIPQNAKVLDISCGNGNELNIVHKYFPSTLLYGIDMQQAEINKALKHCRRGNFQVAYAENLPFENKSFDLIISCMTYHHYKNPAQVIKEVARVLTDEGMFYLGDIIPSYFFSKFYSNLHGCSEPYHFESYYTKNNIEKVLKKYGLTIKEDFLLKKFSMQRILLIKRVSE